MIQTINTKPKVRFHHLGLKDYKETWDIQESFFQEIIKLKAQGVENENHLIFVEHPHVYTLGKSGSENNLLINYIQLQANHASFYKIDRGGDITYHGPGQLVGYPIFNLQKFGIGLKEYIFRLEESIIQSLKRLSIESSRAEGATGVWLDVDKPGKTRKICAIGVKASKWVTMHGFALNINTDLNYFNHINPCGFTDKAVTSIEKELKTKQDFDEIATIVQSELEKQFHFEKL